jgi:hypothetical protein
LCNFECKDRAPVKITFHQRKLTFVSETSSCCANWFSDCVFLPFVFLYKLREFVVSDLIIPLYFCLPLATTCAFLPYTLYTLKNYIIYITDQGHNTRNRTENVPPKYSRLEKYRNGPFMSCIRHKLPLEVKCIIIFVCRKIKKVITWKLFVLFARELRLLGFMSLTWQ